MIMNVLPIHLLDEILFRLEPESLAMMRCTNKYFQSYLSKPEFELCCSWARKTSLFNLYSYGAYWVYCQPLVFSCDSLSPGNVAHFKEKYYIFGSCSGLLLIYIGYLFVVNPLTRRFRVIDHFGSKLLPKIVGGVRTDNPSNPDGCTVRTERAMCVGFAVDRNRTTQSVKIVCIIEMETVYGFEINDGDSWKLSETTITTSSKCGLISRMKHVYVDGNLYWLRNDGSIIAFNPETEQARLIPCSIHWEPGMDMFFAANDKINLLTLISATNEAISVYTLLENHRWALAKQIKNASFDEDLLECWNVVAYDGECLVVREKKIGCLDGVVHVYDMEANTWGVLGSSVGWYERARDYYKYTPSLFSIKEGDEHTKMIVASDDQHISNRTKTMRLIDTTK